GSRNCGKEKKPQLLGATVQSIRPYKSSEQYLYAMKEDLAEWLKELYGLDVNVGSLLEVLETGSVLCYHANNITHVAREFSRDYPGLAHKLQLPRYEVTCNEFAQPGTFQARDNVSNFIQWCRKEMDIKEVLMFETEDLVLRKNEKNFVLCLLELARRASRFGMSAPTLIQMEEEIEEEIREEMALPPEDTPLPKPQRKPCDFKNLDQMVQHLVSRCMCPVQFSMIKVSEGKYRVGNSNTLIFVRILRNHVMVRVGGGWDTLEHYLDKHDPCRCTSLCKSPCTIKICPTPRTENPKKSQPTLVVSRSQSPLPPVEWRTYTPQILSASQKRHSSSSPDSSSKTGASRQMVPTQSERSATPSRRQLLTEERPPSRQSSSTRSGRETRRPARLAQARCSESRPQMTASNDSTAQPPRSTQYGVRPFPQAGGMVRSSSPMKPLHPAALSHNAAHGWREAGSVRSPSPVKHMGQMPKQECSTKIPVKASPTFSRPPTPVKSSQGEPYRQNGRVSKPEDDSQGSISGGDPTGCTEERERVYTPLPINPAQEQALYRSLEDEILSNIKVEPNCSPPSLSSSPRGVGVPRSGVYVPSRKARCCPAGFCYNEVIDELSQGQKTLHRVDVENWIAKVPSKGEVRGSSQPSLIGNQEEKKLLEPEGTWIQEEVSSETKSNGSRRQSSHTSHSGSAGINRNSKAPHATSDSPKASINSPASLGGLEKSKLPQGKPKRSLKKPERVPSIYKLKLRPKIRPRRDNRPEKRPSKIPTPVAYRQAQKVASAKGQEKASSSRHGTRPDQNSLDSSGQNSTGNAGSEEEPGLSEHRGSSQAVKMTVLAETKIWLTEEDEESWV
uniref:GAS2-like protein 2 n=1 Tax=Pelusios castaneus TaxID=367368 RepID=A0A8C8S4N6_9SAUR